MFKGATDLKPELKKRWIFITGSSGGEELAKSGCPVLNKPFSFEALQEALGIPRHIVPIAYLCLGRVSHFKDRPELESAGWLPRLAVEELVFHEQWGSKNATEDGLTVRLREMQAAIQNDGIFPQ